MAFAWGYSSGISEMWIDNKSGASPTVNLEWGNDKLSSASQSIELRAGGAVGKS